MKFFAEKLLAGKLLAGDLKSQLLWCRRAQWGLLAILVLMGGLVFLLGIRPADAELDQLRIQYAQEKSDLEQDQDRAKNLPVVEMKIQQLRQRVERFDKKLPRQQDLGSFINDVTRISQDASLRKLAWHLDAKPRRLEQLTELPIQFTFEGDFETGITQFLRGTEEMPRLTRIRRLDLRSTDAHDGQVRAEVTMNLYFGEE